MILLDWIFVMVEKIKDSNSKLDGSKIQLNRCSSRKAHVFPLLVLRSARKDAGGGLKAFAGEIGRRKRFRSW